MIPIAKYVADEETYQRVINVLESGQLSQGPQVAEFEERVAEISNCNYCVAVNNGTTALEAMLRAAPSGLSGIVTSPLTFRATVKAIQHAGYTPDFYDVDAESLCLDPRAVQFTNNYLMPVDLYGRHARLGSDLTFRDAAQGIGLDLSQSRASAISFYTTKNVGCGEGGAVVTNDEILANQIRFLRNQGMIDGYNYLMPDGFNWRWNELSAATAIPQLKRLEQTNQRRADIAEQYNKAFSRFEGLRLPPLEGETTWHQYCPRSKNRDEIVTRLNDASIGARVYYPELVSPKDKWEETPIALQATKELFAIPIHQHLSQNEVKYIIMTLAGILKSLEGK